MECNNIALLITVASFVVGLIILIAWMEWQDFKNK